MFTISGTYYVRLKRDEASGQTRAYTSFKLKSGPTSCVYKYIPVNFQMQDFYATTSCIPQYSINDEGLVYEIQVPCDGFSYLYYYVNTKGEIKEAIKLGNFSIVKTFPTNKAQKEAERE